MRSIRINSIGRVKTGILLFLFGGILNAHASIVDIGASRIFVPNGYDENDETVVVLEGYFPDTCYKVTQPIVQVDISSRTISIEPRATVFDGPCLMVIVPFNQEVHLGVLPKGNFTIVSKNSDIQTELMVKKSSNPGPDDYIYAPVERADVIGNSSNPKSVVLKGRFTNTCMEWDDIKLYPAQDTIAILPIVKMRNGTDCRETLIDFEKAVVLPKLTGDRFLAHIRSLNGKCINVVFSN